MAGGKQERERQTRLKEDGAGEDPVRLFIAAALPAPMEEAMLEAQRVLRENSRKLTLTKPENLHLTLCFIGNVSLDDAKRIRAWFRRTEAAAGGPHPVKLREYGAFSGRDGRTVWAGLETLPELRELVGMICGELREMGFPIEKRNWKPHITLARRAEPDVDLDQLESRLPKLDGELNLPRISLYRSEFTPGGMLYTPLEAWTLKEDQT